VVVDRSDCGFSAAGVHMRQTVTDTFRHGRLSHEPGVQERHGSLELLVKELQHRMRNLLSIVQCFVTNTEAGTADGYRSALTARIATLSDAYNMVQNAREHRVSLASLLERTLSPHAMFASDRIVLAGPDITLEPHVALSLHMVFHELATNASKHGALRSTSGSVEVLWGVPAGLDEVALAIQWREHGGPKVKKPKQRGFGTQLIAKALPGARVELDFAPDGLICRLLLEHGRSPMASEIVG
jgi:two-component sensor histidine kinase